jgi:hypothetical protein
MHKATNNLTRAGEYFIYSIWLQSQMADLIILKNHPEFISEFVNFPSQIPSAMGECRITYWEKQFYAVKEEFRNVFADLLDEIDNKDLEFVYQMRNAIAHSHISLGREYLLFRPARGEQKEKDLIDTFNLQPREGEAIPMVLKLTFDNDEIYFRHFNHIKRLDEVCFERLSNIIGFPHSRIR